MFSESLLQSGASRHPRAYPSLATALVLIFAPISNISTMFMFTKYDPGKNWNWLILFPIPVGRIMESIKEYGTKKRSCCNDQYKSKYRSWVRIVMTSPQGCNFPPTCFYLRNARVLFYYNTHFFSISKWRSTFSLKCYSTEVHGIRRTQRWKRAHAWKRNGLFRMAANGE